MTPSEHTARWRAKNPGKQAGYQRARNQRRKALLDDLKNQPCADCGGSFPAECMDFDHVSGQKVANVSAMLSFSLDRLLAELDKCDVVCSNCHRIRTKARG